MKEYNLQYIKMENKFSPHDKTSEFIKEKKERIQRYVSNFHSKINIIKR